jgi:hypothetical protein
MIVHPSNEARGRLPSKQSFDLLKLHFALSVTISVISRPEVSIWAMMTNKPPSDAWLAKLLGKSKQGVYEADFEDENGTTINVRDGNSVLLNCRVYLIHDKTVSKLK